MMSVKKSFAVSGALLLTAALTAAKEPSMRPCWRNLTQGARAKIAEYERLAKEYRPHVDRTRMLIRGQFFYGLEKQYYIRNYYERPLMQDSSLAASNEKGHMLNPESWRRTVSVARDMKLDGFAFFPSNPGCWDVLPRSVMPGGEIPILAELHNGDRAKGVKHCADVAGRILSAPNAFKINGKVIITCYPVSSWKSLDFWPKLRQELEKRHGPGKFALMPYAGMFDGADLDKGVMTEDVLERTREHVRVILRNTDGLFYWLRSSAWAAPEVMRRPHNEIIAPLVKSVMAEKEFKDKLLGVGYWQAHENVYRRYGDVKSFGFIRLLSALETIDRFRPDFAIAFEWDEQNENTHFRPTVSNGFTTQRLMRYFADRLAGRAPSLYPRDAQVKDVPNLMVAYQKSLQAGESVDVQVVNVPDGTEHKGDWTVSFSWRTPGGRTVKSFTPQRLDTAKCGMVRFTCPATELISEQILEPVLTVAGDGKERVCSAGLWPMNIEANRNLDCKWVRQSLRDLPSGVEGGLRISAAAADGTRKIEGVVKSPVALRNIEVLEGQDTVYMHSTAHPGGRDDDIVRLRMEMFTLPCFWQTHSSTGMIAVLDAPGAKLSETHPSFVKRRANTWTFGGRNPRLNFVNVFYVEMPAADAKEASILVDLPSCFPRKRINVRDIVSKDAFSFAGPAGAQLVIVRELSQIGMPPPCNVKSAEFSFKFKPRNPLAPIRIQTVDENYRVWRGKALSLNRASGRKESFAVYDVKAGTNRLVTVDSSRIVKLSYRFDSSHADAYYPPVWKDIPIVGGGGAGLLNGFGCGNSRRYGHGVAVGRFALNGGENSDQTAPRLVTGSDGATSLEFTGSSFASMPLQAIPIYAGFELRMKLMPMGMEGEEGLIDSGNQGFQLYLEKGVPSAFIALGNLISERGVNETQGVTVYGPALKRNEWNELIYRFDQRHAWLEVNGVVGEKKPCMGYMSNGDVAAIGVAIKPLKFFCGKIAAIDIRPFGGDSLGGGDLAAALPKAVQFFEDRFDRKGWMTWGPHGFAPVSGGTMKIDDGRIYLSSPCAERSPVPSPACEMGARLRLEIKAKCPGSCRIGVFAYSGKKCTRVWSGKFPGSDKFVLRTFETILPEKADSIRFAVEGRGEYREMKMSRRFDPAYSIRATPAYQLTGDGNCEPVTFTLCKDGVPVDAPQLVVDGLSAYDPESGAVACAYAEKGDAGKFFAVASKVAISAPVNVLYIGDSLTHFDLGRNHADKMAYFLNKANPGMVNLYNYACRGDHIGNVVSRLNNEPNVRFKERYADIWSRKYDWAFVFLGHNDTKASSSKNYTQAMVPPDRQEKLYREMIGVLRSKGVKRIILVSASSSDFSICEAQARKRKGVHNRFGEPKHMEAFNAVLKKLAASEKGVEYMDIYDKMKAHPQKASLVRRQDGVHLSDGGNDFVALEALEYLSKTQSAAPASAEYFQKW